MPLNCAGDGNFCIVTACATTPQLLGNLYLQSSGMLSQARRLASSLHRFSPDKLQACDVSIYVSRLITHIDTAEPAWPESIHPFSSLCNPSITERKGVRGTVVPNLHCPTSVRIMQSALAF